VHVNSSYYIAHSSQFATSATYRNGKKASVAELSNLPKPQAFRMN
jgi:hypothetical protein